jgi:hypothetical protein
MARESKRKDLLRLRAIFITLMEPFSDPEMDFMTVEQKLMSSMQPEKYPIYRRKILRNMTVSGLWWMEEEQWVRFLWNGHKATVIKSDQDPDRVYASHTFNNFGFCYVREHPDRIDLEAVIRTTKWDPVKKKKLPGSACDWMTVTITKEEYERLTPYLGPRDEACRHD